MTIRVNYADDCAITRCLLALERKARFFSPAPENQFADARPSGIDRHQGLALRLQILIEGLNDEELTVI